MSVTAGPDNEIDTKNMSWAGRYTDINDIHQEIKIVRFCCLRNFDKGSDRKLHI